MQIHKFEFSKSRGHEARNAPVVLVEVDARTSTVICGHRIVVEVEKGTGEPIPCTARFEAYADQIDEILDETETPELAAAYAQAVALCEEDTADWVEANAKALRSLSETDRAAYIRRNCNLRPGHYFRGALKRGLRPFTGARLVNRTDGSKTIPLEDFGALTDNEAAEYLGAPPATKDNDMDRMASILAGVMQRTQSRRGKRSNDAA